MCSHCPAGQYGFLWRDTVICYNCPSVKVATADSTKCSSCIPGQVPSNDKSMCLDCETGKYSSTLPLTCSDCDAGKFSATTGSSGCEECATGKTSGTGASVCTTCGDVAAKYGFYERIPDHVQTCFGSCTHICPANESLLCRSSLAADEQADANELLTLRFIRRKFIPQPITGEIVSTSQIDCLETCPVGSKRMLFKDSTSKINFFCVNCTQGPYDVSVVYYRT